MYKTYKQKLFLLLTLLLATPHAAQAAMGTFPNRCFPKKPLLHFKHPPRSYFVTHYRVSSYLALQKSQKKTSLFAQSRPTIFPWASLSYPIKKQTAYISYLSFAKIRPNQPCLTSLGGYYYGQKRLQGDIYKPTTNTGLANITASVEVIRPPMGATAAALQFASTTVDLLSKRQKATNIKIEGQEKRATMTLAHEQEKEIKEITHVHQQAIIASAVDAQKELMAHAQATQQQIDHTRHQHATEFLQKQYDQEAHRKDEDTLKTNLPCPPHNSFVERPEILTEIKQYFTSEKAFQSNQYVTLHGWIGSGKTSLANHYGFTHLRKPYAMVWWIDATSAHTIEESLKDICVKLGGANARTDKSMEEVHKELQIQMSKVSNKPDTRWLVIWDNVNTNSLQAFKKNNSPKNYPSVGGDILITTRDFTLFQGIPLFVDGLSGDEATKLCTQYEKPRSEEEKAILAALIGDTKGLPLALKEAGTYIKRRGNTFKKYIILRKEKPIELKKSFAKLTSQTQKPDLQKEVTESLAQATQIAPEARRLMRLLAYYDHAHLSKEVLLEAIISNEFTCDETIESLQQQGLLYHNSATRSLETHPVYQYLLRSQDHHYEHLKEAASILHTLWENHPQHHELLTPQVHACARYLMEAIDNVTDAPANTDAASTADTPSIHPCNNEIVLTWLPLIQTVVSRYLHQQSPALEKALDLLIPTTLVAEAHPDKPCCAQLYAHFGNVFMLQAAYEKAIEAYQKALEYAPNEIPLYHALAHCYLQTGALNLAAQAYQKSVELEKEKGIAPSKDTSQLAFALGQCYWEINKDSQTALERYQQVLQAKELPEDMKVQAHLNIAFLYAQEGQSQAAAHHYQTALDCLEGTEDKPELLTLAHQSLGLWYQSQQQYTKAVTHLYIAWEYATTCWGEKANDTLSLWESFLSAQTALLNEDLDRLPDEHVQQVLWRAVRHAQQAASPSIAARNSIQILCRAGHKDFSSQDLSNFDLRELNLEGIDLRWSTLPQDLSGINFTAAKLPKNLRGIDFTGAKLPENLAQHNLQGANLSRTDLANVKLPQDLRGINFAGAKLPEDLSQHSIQGANLGRTDLANVKLPDNLHSIETHSRINQLSYSPLTGHTDEVISVAVTTDNKYIVSGGADKTIRIWELETGKEISYSPLKGHTDRVWDVAVTTDNQYIVSSSRDHTIRIWDFKTRLDYSPLKGHTDGVRSVMVTADNKYIVSSSYDNTIRIWNFETGKEVSYSPLRGHTDAVFSVAVTKDNKYIVSGSWDNTIRIWDFKTGKEVSYSPLKGHTEVVRGVMVTTDNKYIVSSSGDSTIRIWDFETGKEVSYSPLEGHTAGLRSVALTTDNKHIVSGSRDETIRIWELKTGKEISYSPLKGHTDWVWSVAVTNDNKYIVSGSRENTIRIWDLELLTFLAEQEDEQNK